MHQTPDYCDCVDLDAAGLLPGTAVALVLLPRGAAATGQSARRFA